MLESDQDMRDLSTGGGAPGAYGGSVYQRMGNAYTSMKKS